jgi:murein DD-endopeptidase MepM/ murein hydrolase activator NlpD
MIIDSLQKNILKATLCILVGVFVLVPTLTTLAQTEEELQSKIEEQNQAIAEIQAEIEKYQKELDAVSGQSQSLKNTISQLSLTEKKLSANVRSTEAKIKSTTSTIQKLSHNISTTTTEINTHRSALKETFRKIRETDDQPFISLFFTKENVTDVANELHEFEQLHNVLGTKTTELLDAKNNLVLIKDKQETEAEKLVRLKAGIQSEKSAIEDTKKEKSVLLSATQKKETVYQTLIEEKNKLKEEYESDLQQYESELAFVLDPNSIPASGDRVLSWPLDYVYITQPFGFTSSSAKLYGYRTGSYKGKHAGVDFRANNDKVYAMATGTVIGIGNTDTVCKNASLGKWVLIKYDNGLTSTYAHLSKVLTKEGARVNTKTVVAYSGNTGYSTAPHLHVALAPSDAVTIETWPSKGCKNKMYTTPIVAGSTYFDPLDYLPEATNDMFKPGSYINN